MPNTKTFESNADRYEAWFEKHPAAYESELRAVRELWPPDADGLEIGVGAGHFAGPLGIRTGVEPAAAMRKAAARRGIHATEGVAERLPFPDARFDAVLMVTTLCFVDDPERAVREMVRVLRPGGCAVVGFVDRESDLGREYERGRDSSVFYADARFFSATDVHALLSEAGFLDLESRQTLFRRPAAMQTPDRVAPGYGHGAFIVVRGWKPPHGASAPIADIDMNNLSTTLDFTDDIRGVTLTERAKIVLSTLGRTPEEIKKAYRRLARTHHPDMPSGDKRKFQVIGEAYAVLTGAALPKKPLLADDALIMEITGRRVEPLIDQQKEWEAYERRRRDRFYGFGVI
jgi:SAM-dependent methyltransferase